MIGRADMHRRSGAMKLLPHIDEAEYFRAQISRDAPAISEDLADLCALDLCDLLDELMSTVPIHTLPTVYAEWLRRLGGTRNIQAYAATLAAGD
jgi:hypothetical protein